MSAQRVDDQSGELQMEIFIDKDTNIQKYKCLLCDSKFKKKFTSLRSDHMKRHISTVHLNKKAVCECGARISPPVLNRHKRTSCPLKKRNASASERIVQSSDGSVSGKCEFNYKIVTSADGMSTRITYDDIVLNGIKMKLVPVEVGANDAQSDAEWMMEEEWIESDPEGTSNGKFFYDNSFTSREELILIELSIVTEIVVDGNAIQDVPEN